MDLGLKNKLALITASSSGIGKAIAEAFLQEGCNVVLNGRGQDKLLKVRSEMSLLYPDSLIDACPADLTLTEQREALKNHVRVNHQELNILVCNLGSGKPETDNQLSYDEWKRMFDINIMSAIALLEGFLPLLKKAQDSNIVLISSITALERSRSPYAYSAAKAALLSLNKNLSAQLAEYGVRVNCVLPGNVLTPGGRWDELCRLDPQGTSEYINNEVPFRRFARPEEIADTVVFLASKRSSFTTGASLVIDGGQTRGF